MAELLPLNAIAFLSLDNLVLSTTGEKFSAVLRRCVPPTTKCFRRAGAYFARPPPVKIPSALPPLGNWHLSLTANTWLNDGRCGWVFSTSVSRLSESSECDQISPIPVLPELVVKVAYTDHRDGLANEAALYDEMETVQGIAIPRCYGFFEVELEQDWTVALLPSDDADDDDGYSIPTPPSSNPSCRRLSVLLLERVGGLPPLLKTYGDEERQDLLDTFEDCGRLGIEHGDIRYGNFLYASPASGSLNLPCPHHNTTHRYRIIDFDRAEKNDFTIGHQRYMAEDSLFRLLNNMEWGNTIEPYDIFSSGSE